ncbi:MAG: Holliday junction resolvase RuvX [Neisseriaceae bacterium]
MPDRETGTVIAIDYGIKRIGLACGDVAVGITHPLVTIRESNKKAKLRALAKISQEWQPIFWVMGVPFYSDGSKNELTSVCLKFASDLSKQLGLSVHLVNEAYTSCYASSLLQESSLSLPKHQAVLDQVSAQAILQAFFSSGSYDCIHPSKACTLFAD